MGGVTSKTAAVFALAVLPACVMTPDEPNLSLTAAADYRTVADCLFLSLSADSLAWQKVELESIHTTRLTLGTAEIQQGIIDVAASGEGTSTVSARVLGTLRFHGKPWRDAVASSVRTCEQKRGAAWL